MLAALVCDGRIRFEMEIDGGGREAPAAQQAGRLRRALMLCLARAGRRRATDSITRQPQRRRRQLPPIAPNEAPSLIITGVIELEKDVMQKKVGYIEHFMMMSEEEKQRRDNLRKGITPGEEKEEEVKEEKPKKEKSKAAAPKEVQIKGDTKLVIKEKTNKDRNLERARSGAAVSADAPAAAAAVPEAAPEDAPEDAPAQDTDAA